MYMCLSMKQWEIRLLQKVYTYNQLLQYIECNPKSDRTIFFKTLPYVSELYNFYIGYKSYYKIVRKRL